MRKQDAHFKITGHPLDRCVPQEGTVTITSGDQPMIEVLPAYGKKTYRLPLAFVASMVVARCIKEEVRR